MPAYALSPRDLSSDVASAKTTFSSWDGCMSEAYCKYPVIVAIIIGSLIVLSIVWCLARCLCCGAECCCGCMSCCNRCCPSPRNRKDGYENQGYQQPPPQQPWQYQSPQPPMYGGAAPAAGYGYRGPQTATFDVSSKNQRGKNGASGYNEDALPAMPSWDTAANRHVEDDEDEDAEGMELEKLDYTSPQHASFISNGHNNTDYAPVPTTASAAEGGRFYAAQDASGASDLGTMRAQQTPYSHDYDRHQQYAPSPVSSIAPSSAYPPTYRTQPPAPQSSTASTVYEPYSAGGYAQSAAPSYHTVAQPFSPQQQRQSAVGGIGRKPVNGSYRDV